MSKIIIPGHPDFNMQPNGNINIGTTLVDIRGLAFKAAVEKTISTGAITLDKDEGHFRIDTESDDPNDDLDTINGGESGEIVFFLPANDARTVRIRNGVGNFYTKHQTEVRSYHFSSPSGSSGTFYSAGEYFAASGESALTNIGPTQTHGSANIAYASHAFAVAKGDGATDGSDLVLTVSGTSIDDDGTRSAADSEVVVADARLATFATNAYMETTKKWIGQITYTLTSSGGGTFNCSFNYGLAKYEDFGNQDFTITLLECVGFAGANDTGFNIRLLHHSSAGWAYAASGFVPGGTVLANMNTDYNTEINLANGEPISYKRVNLNTDVMGTTTEGLIIEITTSANKAVEDLDIHFGVHTAPKYAYLATTKQHLIAMKHGSNWLEL